MHPIIHVKGSYNLFDFSPLFIPIIAHSVHVEAVLNIFILDQENMGELCKQKIKLFSWEGDMYTSSHHELAHHYSSFNLS